MKSFKTVTGSSRSPMKAVSMENSRQGFTEDEIEELREAFNLFDTEGRGIIDPRDLKAAMHSLGFEAKNPIIYEIISDMDTGSEGIAFEPFLEILATKLGDRQSKEGIDRIFRLMDSDKSRTIDVNDLKKVSKEIGENATHEELKELLSRAATNGVEITPEDFYRIMTKKSYV
eukprot:TRINITY_DN8395_c0_g4_i1.p1 TRINITY_DN8395_c0_g4~~TRINITY_DN8395_c0_g4_i1.p1  ORF type:complete len:173 (-),score=62.23 TRINITY_DN8395_c0_g4_i1:117-635(-)